MALTPGGRIWLGWFAGGDDERAVIVLARSDDGGETFSEPQFILDPGAEPLFSVDSSAVRFASDNMIYRVSSGQSL